MTDPKRHDAKFDAGSDAGSDSRVDELLVDGLDRYFQGQYEDAIHLWTRVLFLDRSHASARAYIDRARGAIVERQRRAEEALQHVVALLDQGRVSEARQSLPQVTATLGEDERTAALRLRLERLEIAVGGGPRIRAAEDVLVVRRGAWLLDHLTMRTWLAAAALVVVTVVLVSVGQRTQQGARAGAAVPAPTLSAAPVPTLTPSEVALIRARALYARGRLAEALRTLDRIKSGQAGRDESDRLRVDIQRLLLAAAGEGRVPGDGRQGPR